MSTTLYRLYRLTPPHIDKELRTVEPPSPSAAELPHTRGGQNGTGMECLLPLDRQGVAEGDSFDTTTSTTLFERWQAEIPLASPSI
jgi:hypothetical protein